MLPSKLDWKTALGMTEIKGQVKLLEAGERIGVVSGPQILIVEIPAFRVVGTVSQPDSKDIAYTRYLGGKNDLVAGFTSEVEGGYTTDVVVWSLVTGEVIFRATFQCIGYPEARRLSGGRILFATATDNQHSLKIYKEIRKKGKLALKLIAQNPEIDIEASQVFERKDGSLATFSYSSEELCVWAPLDKKSKEVQTLQQVKRFHFPNIGGMGFINSEIFCVHVRVARGDKRIQLRNFDNQLVKEIKSNKQFNFFNSINKDKTLAISGTKEYCLLWNFTEGKEELAVKAFKAKQLIPVDDLTVALARDESTEIVDFKGNKLREFPVGLQGWSFSTEEGKLVSVVGSEFTLLYVNEGVIVTGKAPDPEVEGEFIPTTNERLFYAGTNEKSATSLEVLVFLQETLTQVPSAVASIVTGFIIKRKRKFTSKDIRLGHVEEEH